MKIIVLNVLKLWPVEIVKHHGGHFEKMSFIFLCHCAYFPNGPVTLLRMRET